ncbi:MAG TPA: rhodanese-like domain-containing protein [Thermoanaerobaculia bacterium]|nr:rhodanese-like domain-containing protein [Thermoanaerobaculia bacterium]
MKPLLSAAELVGRLDAVRLIDARGGGRDAYAVSHLAGAVFADLEQDLATPGDPRHGGRHPLPDIDAWCRTLGGWDIGPSTPVVIYDEAGGANAAARAWWMLRAVGHELAAVLDGGLRAALEAGVPTTAEAPTIVPQRPYPSRFGGRWGLPLARAAEVEEVRLDPDRCLLDVRAELRYRGDSDPFDPVPGHIPGALNLPYAGSLGADGRFLPAAELRRRFEEALDGRAAAETTVYCGSGVTACHALLAMAHAGLGDAVLYVGSWSEWCRSDRPRASVVRP